MGATALATAPAYADDVAPTPTPTPTPSPTPSPADDKGRGHYVPDPRILWVDVDPDVVVVGKRDSVRVTATVKTKDVKSVSIEVWEPNGHGGHGHGGGHWLSTRGHDGPYDGPYDGPRYGRESRSWDFGWSHKSGVWKVHVEAVGADGRKISADRRFVVKRKKWEPPRPTGPKATRIVGFDASPEPVRRGRALTLEGTLQAARCYGDWYYDGHGHAGRHGGDRYCDDDRGHWHHWHWLGSQDIDVYFLPAGSRKWKYVRTVESDADGDFSTEVRAFRSGTWAVRFDGTRRLKGSGASDYVKVWRR